MIWAFLILAAPPSLAGDFGFTLTPTAGTCPGPHDLDVTGTVPETRVAILTAEGFDGGQEIPGCDGVRTDIGPSGFSRRVTQRTDVRGEVHRSVMIPESACGLQAQAVNLDACSVSTALELGGIPESLPCACAGDFRAGDRVVATVDGPADAMGLFAGAKGTVVAGIDGDLSILVRWDDWDLGHTGNCRSAECGTCIEGVLNRHWWVACEEITREGLTCLEDRYEPNDTIPTAPPLTTWFDDWCGEVDTRYIEGQLCVGDDDYFEIPVSEGTEITVRALFSDAEGDLDLELVQDGIVVDGSYGVGDLEQVSLYSDYTLYGCGWDVPCPPDPVLRVFLSADDGVVPGTSYVLEIQNEDYYYPDYCY